MKKRSCRRTTEEKAIHERAVSLRKMTDEQLCGFIERERAQCIEDAYKEGYEAAEKKLSLNKNSVREFIDAVKNSRIPGFGTVTIDKLMQIAIKGGFI